MGQEFTSLNRERRPEYRKDERSEDFLSRFNEYLFQREKAEYQEHPIEHPFLFVIGAPRSGTTLLTQTLVHSLDLGYIDNLAARFFMAPLHGMRFSRAVFGKEGRTDHRSDHAATKELSDIHEFGYFWREWLNKKRFDDITHAKEKEDGIDWNGLRRVLSSMQSEAGRPMLFKNSLGSYHMPRFEKELGKVLFLHIVRNEMDAALSILEARKRYNQDLRTWWSYQPLEYEALKDRDPYEQIAGQVLCLRSFYRKEMEELSEQKALEIPYERLCREPLQVAEEVQRHCEGIGKEAPAWKKELPGSFEFRQYEGKEEEKERFREAFATIRKEFDV